MSHEEFKGFSCFPFSIGGMSRTGVGMELQTLKLLNDSTSTWSVGRTRHVICTFSKKIMEFRSNHTAWFFFYELFEEEY